MSTKKKYENKTGQRKKIEMFLPKTLFFVCEFYPKIVLKKLNLDSISVFRPLETKLKCLIKTQTDTNFIML